MLFQILCSFLPIQYPLLYKFVHIYMTILHTRWFWLVLQKGHRQEPCE